eukprot:TRINITY_DN75386_c0_g1_i1.p1 TRINITY_DN75386_c0_g1~~TRINITY_DN75386_c0_g1_i1.p1  ORF type:complete len:514 (-),score=72.00 TRINITY_DN75386_c0_g1_i1:4-1545(-)
MFERLHCFTLPLCVLATGVAACTPIYPQCICRTENLTCETIEAIRLTFAKRVWGLRVPGNTTEELTAAMDALKADPAHKSVDAANFVGGVVRLAWHDAAEYDPESADTLRPDGCVNLADNSNAGLDVVIAELDTLWLPFCDKISRADFWVLAAKTVIEESTSYVPSQFGRNVNAVDGGSHGSRRLLKGEAILDGFVLPFRYGRQDVSSCSVSGKARLPSAEKGATQIQTYIMQKFNLNARHAVALLGAHTLGRCDVNISGYNSTWKDRGDLFTTAYFKYLLVGQWKREQMVDPRSGQALFQWNHQTKSDREQWAMMLATDMQLVYAIEPENRSNQAFAIECGPLDKESDKSLDLRCPTTGSIYPSLNFETYVQEFAEGETATHDEPGASKWLVAFAEAFRKMTEIGYDSQVDLHCAECPPEICSSCSQDVLCGSGEVYFENSSTPVAPIGGSSGGYTFTKAGVSSPTSSTSMTGIAGSTSTTMVQGTLSNGARENAGGRILMLGLLMMPRFLA